MSEWKKVRLGEVAELVAGYAFKSKCFGDYNSKVIKITDINNEGFFCAALPGVDISQLDKKKLDKYLVKRGDYVLAMTGSIGKIGKLLDGVAYINQRVLTVKAFENTDHEYLYFCLKGKPFLEYMLTHIDSHSVQANISASTIGDFELSLPPLPTQRKIAAVLSSLDDKIENNRKICANLEAQAQAIFKSWFVDFEPFGGKMPQGWKMGKLGDVAELNPYRALKKGVKARCVEMADLVTSTSFPASWSYKEYSGGMKFANGDTIIARITPCFENGKSAYVNFLEEGEVAFGSTEYVVMASRSVVPPELFYCVAKDPEFISFAKSRMVGSSGRQRFSAEDIAMYPMVIAPDEVYLKVQPLLRSFMDQVRTLGFESRTLAALRDALLPKLMSGEIGVEKVKVA